MTLIRWTPARSRNLADLHPEMDQLLGSLLGARGCAPVAAGTFAPPVDVEETPEAFVLRADLPGISQKDFKVTLVADTLTLRGERQRETGKPAGAVHRSERVYGAFERTFTLNSPVRADQVKATYRDGVLEIVVPKAEEARVREIEVLVG